MESESQLKLKWGQADGVARVGVWVDVQLRLRVRLRLRIRVGGDNKLIKSSPAPESQKCFAGAKLAKALQNYNCAHN